MTLSLKYTTKKTFDVKSAMTAIPVADYRKDIQAQAITS